MKNLSITTSILATMLLYALHATAQVYPVATSCTCSGTDALVWDCSNVGIGTTSPPFQLTVEGDFQCENTATNYFMGNNADQLGMGINGAGSWVTDGSGNNLYTGVVDMSPLGLTGEYAVSAFISDTNDQVFCRHGLVGTVPTATFGFESNPGNLRIMLANPDLIQLKHFDTLTSPAYRQVSLESDQVNVLAANGVDDIASTKITPTHWFASQKHDNGADSTIHSLSLSDDEGVLRATIHDGTDFDPDNYVMVTTSEVKAYASSGGNWQNDITVDNAAGGLTFNTFDGTDDIHARLNLTDGFLLRGKDNDSSTLGFNIQNNGTSSLFEVYNNGDVTILNELTVGNFGAAGGNDISENNGLISHSTSDRRLKNDIEPMESTLDKVLKLNSVSFNWNDRPNAIKKDFGFIAQEVNELFPEVVFNAGDEGYLGINYSRFPAILAKAMQEQQEQIEAKDTRINELEEQATDLNTRVEELENQLKEVDELKDQMEELKGLINNICQNGCGELKPQTDDNGVPAGTGSTIEDKPVLFGNFPNPYGQSTDIKYYLPEGKTGVLEVRTMDEKLLHTSQLKAGNGSITIANDDFASGVYLYSLIVDGGLVKTMKMVKQD